MLGLSALLAALTEVRFGLTGMVGLLVVVSAVVLLAFVVIEPRVGNPILRIDLFRQAAFTGATLAAFASGAGVLALISLVPRMLVRGAGLSPVQAAVLLLAWSG